MRPPNSAGCTGCWYGLRHVESRQLQYQTEGVEAGEDRGPPQPRAIPPGLRVFVCVCICVFM